jgi:hypothetical protein
MPVNSITETIKTEIMQEAVYTLAMPEPFEVTVYRDMEATARYLKAMLDSSFDFRKAFEALKIILEIKGAIPITRD